jgi:type I restriction enzyme S subunit
LLFRHSNPIVIFGDHTKNIKYIDFDFVVGADGVHILSPIEIIFPKFFYYQLCSIKLRNLGYARHYKLLKQSFIAIPPLSEQERIVSLLDLEFAKIDAIKANAEKQLQDAKDLFQSALKDLLTPKEGWKKGCLGDFLNFRRGYDLTHAEMKAGDIPVAGSSGIIGYHDVATNVSPCITVGRSGSVGKLNVYDKCWAHNTTLFIDDFKGNSPKFLVYLVQSLGIASYSGGSAVPTLNRNYIHPIKTALPTCLDEQKIIVEKLDVLSEKLKELQSNYEQTITLCNDLKQSILKDIFG